MNNLVMRRVHGSLFVVLALVVSSCVGGSDAPPDGTVASSVSVEACREQGVAEPGVIVDHFIPSVGLGYKDSWHMVTADQVQVMLGAAEVDLNDPRTSSVVDPAARSMVGGMTIRVGTEAIEDWKAAELVGELAIGGKFDEGFPDTWLWSVLATSNKAGLNRVGLVGCRGWFLDGAIAQSGRVDSLYDLIALATDPVLNAEWEADLMGIGPTRFGWIKLDPWARNLSSPEASVFVLDELQEAHFTVVIPENWISAETTRICTFAEGFGRNDCVTLEGYGRAEIELFGYLPPSGLLEFSMYDRATGQFTDLGIHAVATAGSRFVLNPARPLLAEEVLDAALTMYDAEDRFREMLEAFQPGSGLQVGGAAIEDLGVLYLEAVHGQETDAFVLELLNEFGGLVLVEWVECIRC